MKRSTKELNELLEFIETNKHNVTMRVRSVVRDPIHAMNKRDAATDSYYREIGNKHSEVIDSAQEIMSFFAQKWRDPDDPEDKQLDTMRNHIKEVATKIIPQIRQIVKFYAMCSNKKFYFSDTENGKKALEKMLVAVSQCERVCERLVGLETEISEEKESLQICNLLELLQEELDYIGAEVRYANEWESSKVCVSIKPKSFLDNVLVNIKENIVTHAFGTYLYRQKYIWEKKVCVEIEEKGHVVQVLISNNGEPFLGDISRVFEYGYCYGEKKNTGIGMYSIKKSMKEMGGDADFLESIDSQYTTTYKLIIAK